VKSIQVDGDVYAYLQAHGMSTGHSASDVLRQALFHGIDIDDDVFSDLMSLAGGPTDTVNAILRRALGIQASLGPYPPPGNPPPVTPATRIDFHIPSGTGSGSWNTRDTAVNGVVGQTLRIYNDDSVPHRPQSRSSVPFAVPTTDIASGTFQDLMLQSPCDLGTSQAAAYDHVYGPNAQFWISVTGAA
jgi:predicted CopG family antitoxin